jgi:hypothetical protein
MNKLKTYEGFFDFLKKSKKSITHRDILDCLYDIYDESRITSELNGNVDGIFHELSDIVDSRDNIDGLKIIGDIATFKLQYDPNEIYDNEVSEIFKNCQSHLSGYDCEMTFFIGRGKSEGTSWDKEFSDLNKMISKTINRMEYGKKCIRNITIKIKAKGGISK